MIGAGEPVPENGHKRLGTDEEEDEAGPRELDGQNGNQDSEVADEKEDRNQENNNEEEDKKEEGKTEEEAEEGKTEGLDGGGEEEEPGQNQLGETDEDPNEKEEEHRQNAGSGNNVNHQNSEQNESRNQESEGDEDGENENNEEERRRKAAKKGKRPMSCKLEPIEPEFSEEFEEGESSNTPEDQTSSDIAIDDHRDLAILRSMWNYKYNNGNIPHPPSDELLKYVMDSIPNFKLLKEFLKMKIMEFESNFRDIIQMDGDNPEMTRPLDRETFELCKRLWGNQQQRQSCNQQQRQSCNQQQQLGGNQLQTAHFCLIHYQRGDYLTIYLIIFR